MGRPRLLLPCAQHAGSRAADAGARRFSGGVQKIRDLPGVGDYTAAAISSIAFNLPHAALDGNVLRVLSRVLDERTNIASSMGRQRFAALAQGCWYGTSRRVQSSHDGTGRDRLPSEKSAVPIVPDSEILPCARKRHANELPMKAVRAAMVQEQRVVFWIEKEGAVLLWQRPPTARLMPGFWELPEAIHLPSATPGAKLAPFGMGLRFIAIRLRCARPRRPRISASASG